MFLQRKLCQLKVQANPKLQVFRHTLNLHQDRQQLKSIIDSASQFFFLLCKILDQALIIFILFNLLWPVWHVFWQSILAAAGMTYPAETLSDQQKLFLTNQNPAASSVIADKAKFQARPQHISIFQLIQILQTKKYVLEQQFSTSTVHILIIPFNIANKCQTQLVRKFSETYLDQPNSSSK